MGAFMRNHIVDFIGAPGVSTRASGTPTVPIAVVGVKPQAIVSRNETPYRRSKALKSASGLWQWAQLAWRYERALSSRVAPGAGDPSCPGYGVTSAFSYGLGTGAS